MCYSRYNYIVIITDGVIRMIGWLSEKLASAMVDSGAAKESDREIYVYGLEILISTAASVACVIVAGLLLGEILETLVFLAFFIALRSAAGGFHASSHLRCFLITMGAYAITMALVLVMPAVASRWAALPVAAAALVAVAGFAPAPHENRPASGAELKKFRAFSLWIAAVQLLIVAAMAVLNLPALALAAALAMAASSLSLIAAHLAGLEKKKPA